MGLLEKLIAKPPTYLGQLEALIGPLLMNIDDGEGMGHISRPAFEDQVALCLQTAGGELLRVCAAEPRRLAGGAQVTAADGRAWFEGRALEPGDVIEAAGSSYRFVTEELARDRFSDEVGRVFVNFYWDMYHEHAERYRDPQLKDYTLTIATPDRAAAERALAAAAKAKTKPRVLDDGHSRWIAYEPFYLEEKPRAGEIELRWLAEKPEWAYVKPTASVREQFVVDLAALLRGGGQLPEIKQLFAALPAEVGLEVHGSLNRNDWQFSFKPPFDDALAFARALGVDEPTSNARDVHMSTWGLSVGDSHKPPKLGSWFVEADLDGWPKLLDESTGKYPHYYDLKKCKPLRVKYVRIGPPW
jgi:hypothetical protein